MCAWDKTLPAGAGKIKDSDDAIRANNAALETVLGTNLTSGPTSIQDAILGDGTKGRNMRMFCLFIDNGTNGVSLKCKTVQEWNGDVIAEVDDIIKNATTGDFNLDADGEQLTIEASGLSGNVVAAIGTIRANLSGTDLTVYARDSANDIMIGVGNAITGANIDLTTLVDTGKIIIHILYITDA